jgi:hypothetical protein
VATAAVQYLQGLDSGETLSTQQLSDARAAANLLIESWYQEQVLSIQLFLSLYTLAGGTYTPGTQPSFPDNTTVQTFPLAYIRSLELNLAIELGPQYAIQPTGSLIKQAAEARKAATPVVMQFAVPQRTDEGTG